jgi:hypothetical protein
MEIALERIRAPYCVLTVGAADQYVDVRFSPDMQQYLGLSANEFAEVKQEHSQKYPRNFTLEIPRPVVIVYKMHGCLFPEQPGRDTVVLSDEDYIRYLSRMSDNIGMVPSAVTNLTKSCGFLFLGYSFSDWNVRGIYKAVVRHRTAAERMQDYALVREFSSYESAFCRETASRINLLVTDLPKFARRVLAYARPRRRTRLKAKTA